MSPKYSTTLGHPKRQRKNRYHVKKRREKTNKENFNQFDKTQMFYS